MINLGSAIQILVIYLSLSKQGKRFLKKAVGKSRQVNKTLAKSVLGDLSKILYFIKTLKVCDKVFSRQVSDQLCSDLGREKSAMYARFVAYGWFSLLIWSKILEAFNIPYDQDAKERCVLVAFTHREWNDLFDNRGYSFKELVMAFDYQAAIPKELIFLRQLKQMERKLAPPDRFGKFYQHMQGFDICSLFEYSPEKAEIILDQVAPFVALLFMYIMVGEIPEGLKEIIKPTARWLYMLDELTDLEDDKKINRVTYMIMVKEPEKEMWKQFQTCREVILRIAPNPDKVISFMETITSKVIDAKKRGVDIESSFFNIG
jgi:hypothetical protein